MPQKINFLKLLTKKPFNFIAIFLLLGIIIIFAVVSTGKTGIGGDRVSRVEISEGGRSITINENGLVEIKTEAGVTYETLDSAKLTNLFKYFKKKAQEVQRLSADSPGNIIAVTLIIDGKEVTIYIDADDPEFQQIIDDILSGGSGEDIGDYFGEDDEGTGSGDNGDNGFFDLTPTPTPINFSGPTPTGTGSPNLYLPPGVTDPGGDCTSWNEQVIGKAVISNTVCFKQ